MKLRSLRFPSVLVSLIAFAMLAPAHAHPDHDNERTAEQALAGILPEINFNAVAAGDVFEFIRDITKSDINVDWDALQNAGVDKNTPVTLRVKNEKLSEVLGQLFQNFNPTEPLAFKPDGKTIRISTEAKLNKK